MQLKVTTSENGLFLIQFLARHLSVSNNAAKKIIDQRRVFVNGRRVWMARHRLQAGDRITGCFEVIQHEKRRSIPLPVIYEDNDYLIADKPAGIASNGPNSAEQLLKNQLQKSFPNPPRPSAVALRAMADKSATPPKEGNLTDLHGLQACHRLDKDTSGCLIFAKHPAAKEQLIHLFARNQIKKKYEAIVKGRLMTGATTIAKPLEGRKAISHVRLLDASPFASHIAVSIETGRTHQIRKHLAAIGHPVLGDQQYGGNRALSAAERAIPRQMLHAAEISFTNPLTGKPIHCRAESPADFKTCLKRFHLK
jgi:RluA family pseudouridine synthase